MVFRVVWVTVYPDGTKDKSEPEYCDTYREALSYIHEMEGSIPSDLREVYNEFRIYDGTRFADVVVVTPKGAHRPWDKGLYEAMRPKKKKSAKKKAAVRRY